MTVQSRRATLARKQLDAAFERTSTGSLPSRPAGGWVAAIRSALGMTTRQLATRIGVRQPSVVALEKSEVAGTASLNTLRRAAEAMNCELVYMFVPRRSLDATVRQRAMSLAEIHVAAVSHSMDLEGQGISTKERTAEARRLAEALLEQGSRLWDEP
jgi:predicted DNA-binding mobile mystery protein A